MTRYLGMSRIKFYHLRRKVRFVVMHSVHPTPLHVHRTYDLKGCTHGRRTTDKERERDRRLGIGLHLKDLDLIDDKFTLALDTTQKKALMAQLRLDVDFLAAQRIMDYSLLVGVHDPLLDDDGNARAPDDHPPPDPSPARVADDDDDADVAAAQLLPSVIAVSRGPSESVLLGAEIFCRVGRLASSAHNRRQ